ncbi:MAG: hypothetical protein M1812_000814 [Candelaria pacifica]|nr:MAG: hypothetical protein M1812_000814 [Candelaria pacifica]
MPPNFARDRYWPDRSAQRGGHPKEWERRRPKRRIYNNDQPPLYPSTLEQKLASPSIYHAAPFAHQASVVDTHHSKLINKKGGHHRWTMVQTFSALHREREYLLSVLQKTNGKAAKLVSLLAQADRKLDQYLVQSQSESSNQCGQSYPSVVSSNIPFINNANSKRTSGFAKEIKHERIKCRKFRGKLKRIEAQERAILNNLGRVTWSIQAKEIWIAASEAQMAQLSPHMLEQPSNSIGNCAEGFIGHEWQDGNQYQQEWPSQYYETGSERDYQAPEGCNNFAIRASLSERWADRTSAIDSHSTYPQMEFIDRNTPEQAKPSDQGFADPHIYQQQSRSSESAHRGIPLLVSATNESNLHPDDLAASVALYSPFISPFEQHTDSNPETTSTSATHLFPPSEVLGTDRRASDANRVVDYWPKQIPRKRSRTRSLPANLIENHVKGDMLKEHSESEYLGYGIVGGGLGSVREE